MESDWRQSWLLCWNKNETKQCDQSFEKSPLVSATAAPRSVLPNECSHSLKPILDSTLHLAHGGISPFYDNTNARSGPWLIPPGGILEKNCQLSSRFDLKDLPAAAGGIQYGVDSLIAEISAPGNQHVPACVRPHTIRVHCRAR